MFRKRLRDWLFARSNAFRRERMQAFLDEFRPTGETRILDIGGTDLNWRMVAHPAHVVLLNTYIPEGGYDPGLLGSEYEDAGAGKLVGNVEYVLGDGKSVPYPDGAFDICFSNSTIEHMSSFQKQRVFADQVRRVARGVWVQTPARTFPFEPHWLSPFIHWLPKSLQRRLGRNFTVFGWMVRPSSEGVAALVDELRLLGFREMQELFPDCEIRRERFIGLTKSYIAVRHVPGVGAEGAE